MWKIWVYLHSALEPSRAVAEAVAAPPRGHCRPRCRGCRSTVVRSLPGPGGRSTPAPSACPGRPPAHLLLPPMCQTTSSARCWSIQAMSPRSKASKPSRTTVTLSMLVVGHGDSFAGGPLGLVHEECPLAWSTRSLPWSATQESRNDTTGILPRTKGAGAPGQRSRSMTPVQACFLQKNLGVASSRRQTNQQAVPAAVGRQRRGFLSFRPTA
jgi:hypothetical protein